MPARKHKIRRKGFPLASAGIAIRRRAWLYFSLCLFSLLPSPSDAWQGHHLITALILDGIDWPDRFAHIPVTPCSYRDPSLNPAFEVLYIDRQAKAGEPRPEESPSKDREGILPYRCPGAGPGSETNAKEILINYSDEPDWEMDQDLHLGFSQRLMGGSKGIRHAYYPTWTWHLPGMLVS